MFPLWRSKHEPYVDNATHDKQSFALFDYTRLPKFGFLKFAGCCGTEWVCVWCAVCCVLCWQNNFLPHAKLPKLSLWSPISHGLSIREIVLCVPSFTIPNQQAIITLLTLSLVETMFHLKINKASNDVQLIKKFCQNGI